MIKEDYVSFEVAKLLKEKGFDWECIGYYVDDEPNDIKYSFLGETNSTWESRCCSAPTHQMAMKWLREVYKLEVRSTYDYDKDSWWGNINPMFEETDENTNVYQKALRFDYQGKSYEEAVEAALKYSLENLI